MLTTFDTILIYRNEAGQQVSLAPFSDYWLTKCEDPFTNEIHSTKQVGTHGKFFTGMSINERFITITGEVKHGIDIHMAKRTLELVFNPILDGTLIYRRDKITADIACKVVEKPNVYWSGKRLQYDLQLVALDPFWKGQSVIESIALMTKMFHFPLAIPSSGVVFGWRRQTLESEFINRGNAESGFVAKLTSPTGTVVNPEVKNMVTGQQIKLNYTMQKNDIIEITSSLQVKRVFINGISSFKYLDVANTKFFLLAVGTNKIGYNADANVSNLNVFVTYVPEATDVEVFG